MSQNDSRRNELETARRSRSESHEFAAVLAFAKERGFRLAEIDEQMFLSPEDLFLYRGEVFVKDAGRTVTLEEVPTREEPVAAARECGAVEIRGGWGPTIDTSVEDERGEEPQAPTAWTELDPIRDGYGALSSVRYQDGEPVEVLFPNGWHDGVFTGYRAGSHEEDFQRIDVRLSGGRVAMGCHPDCVRRPF